MGPATGPRAAHMPLYEPSHDTAAASLLREAALKGISKDQESFSFPADENFWENFKLQAALCDEAHGGNVFEVSSNVDPTSLSVNQDWLFAFVNGWQQQHPHFVQVKGKNGDKRFYASEEFWQNMLARLGSSEDTGEPGADEVLVCSDQLPGVAIRSPEHQWDAAVQDWEESRQCSEEALRQHMKRRAAEGERAQRQRESRTQQQQVVLVAPPPKAPPVLSAVPLPVMGLPAGDPGVSDSQVNRLGELDGVQIDFPADANFWRCLRRWCFWEPGSMDPPTFLVDTVQEDGSGSSQQPVEVGQDFLRRFLVAWRRAFPVVLGLAARSGGRVLRAACNVNTAVLHEVQLRARRVATPEDQRRIPEGMVLVDTGDQPLLLSVEGWLEVVRMWPEQHPDADDLEGHYTSDTGTVAPAVLSAAEHAARQSRAVAPAVRPPPGSLHAMSSTATRAGLSSQGPHPSRGAQGSRYSGAALPRRDVPVVQLQIHSGVVERQRRRPPAADAAVSANRRF